MGLTKNLDNQWVKKAATIPWGDIEVHYAEQFPSTTGMLSKPLRATLGSLLKQKQYDYSDRRLVDPITKNLYYQYFIGLARVIHECAGRNLRYYRPVTIMKLSRYIRPLLRPVYEQNKHYEFSVA